MYFQKNWRVQRFCVFLIICVIPEVFLKFLLRETYENLEAEIWTAYIIVLIITISLKLTVSVRLAFRYFWSIRAVIKALEITGKSN